MSRFFHLYFFIGFVNRNDTLRTSVRIFEVKHASSAEAGMITQVLQLAVKVTSGVWSPVSEKDKELSLQIISICEDLIKVGTGPNIIITNI